ncbi:MAG TPA: DUF4089 domain-containing protein [Acetobacteraceae bacterium]|nr:DUF4089 domain-containing protein [Acetobacteraceae bacterium]
MSDSNGLDAWLNANAALLGITVAPEWRDAVQLHLRITRDMAQCVLDFPLPDDADPAPVFHA